MRVLSCFFTALTLAPWASAVTPAQVFKRAEKFKPALEKRTTPDPVHDRLSLQKRSSPFLTDKTESFLVNGSAIPDVPFDIGESYAGLLPISDDPDETRKLYFWFFPSTNANASDLQEVTFWFNGGPGCSSLSGFLTENGPFTWEAGTLAPVQNAYSWTNLTNMVWVEQPVGVGFTQGVPNITNEVELAQQWLGFYRSFINTFDMLGWDLYLTGESYAGFYVPYVADAVLAANDTAMPLKGIAINDPSLADGTMQQHAVAQPYVEYWSELFYLNDTFRAAFEKRNDECGYTDYVNTYLQFPPPEESTPVLTDPYSTENNTCAQLDTAIEAITLVNPCFNIYHITETCPHPYSQLGIVNSGDYVPPGAQVYFNRSDVQEAINAPVGTNWEQCSSTNVFGGPNDDDDLSDTSLGPAQNGVLQRVIEATNNVIVGSGNLDFLLNTNGTLMAIQNMTWNGQKGLQSYPDREFYTPYHSDPNGGSLAGAGVQGLWGTERGLTFYQVQLGGHEVPGYVPGAAYRSIELLLGRISDLSEERDFTTQMGNFTGMGTIYHHQKRQFQWEI